LASQPPAGVANGKVQDVTIAYAATRIQPQNVPPEAAVSRLNPEGPDRCPTCGRPYAPCSLQASGVLDTLHLGQDVLREAIALVEEDVLP